MLQLLHRFFPKSVFEKSHQSKSVDSSTNPMVKMIAEKMRATMQSSINHHMKRVSLWANHYGNMIWSNLHLPWPFLPLFWRLNYNLTRLKTCGWSLNDLVEVLPWPLLYMNVKLFSFSGWMTMTEHMKCLKGHCKCRPCKLSTSNLWSILIQTGKCRPCKLLTSNSL